LGANSDEILVGTLSTGTYSASNSITSTGTVNSGANVSFIAGNNILLQPPFTVQAGAAFSATIGSFSRIPFTPLSYAFIPVRQPSTLDHTISIQNDFESNVFTVYPNPANDFITIEWDLKNESETKIQLLGISGQIIRTIISKKFKSGLQKTEVNISDLKPGVFFILIKKNNKSSIHSFIKN
jgi:hypothetical protein